MTAVFLKLAEARESLGNRFGWEVAGIPTALVVFMGAIALAGTGLAGPEGPEPHSRLGASHGIPIAGDRP